MRNFSIALIALGAVVHLAPTVTLGDVVPDGVEFQINTYTTGSQGVIGVARSPRSVTVDGAGNFLVVWTSTDSVTPQDGSSGGVFAQRYDASGNPLGTEFQINTYTSGYQLSPVVDVAGDGSFVVVWDSFAGQDGDGPGIFGQRFSSAGTPLGTEFQVNSYTTGSQSYPDVAVAPSGEFSVVWGGSPDGDQDGVLMRRYDQTGAALGTEVQVNTYTTGTQDQPFVALDDTGNAVVVWVEDSGQDGDGAGVFGQRFDSSGARLGTEFQVNTVTQNDQLTQAVAMDNAGNFVVAWVDFALDGDGLGVFARRYAASGSPAGDQFQVNSYTTSDQLLASIGMSTDGNFVIAWTSGGNDGSGYGVVARYFDGAGVGSDEFQVNSYTTQDQTYPSVAGGGGGRFVAVWTSGNGQDGDLLGVFGQRLLDVGPCGIVDNCPAYDNPDQLNSDCPDPDFLACVGCAGNVPPELAGCCDGGDVCDPCPAYADNTRCDPADSASAVIGSTGGTIQTDEVAGTVSATVAIPPGALSTDTTVSVTENGPGTRFGLKKEGGTADVLSVGLRPEGQQFAVPVVVTLRWDDRDMDGLVDRGVCEGGPDVNLPCDEDADCADGATCSIRSSIPENRLVVKRNNNRFGYNGISTPPYTCGDHLKFTCSLDGAATCYTNTDCATVSAGVCTSTLSACNSAANVDACSLPSGDPRRTLALCCDSTAGPVDARVFGEWSFQTCDFSEFLVGLNASALVPGKGSPKTDCFLELAPNNPANEVYLDKNGLPNFKQACSDGDPVCDRDGEPDGACTFEIALCVNVEDPRLVKSAAAQCTPNDVAKWRVLSPRTTDSDIVKAANAAELVARALELGSGGETQGLVTFVPAVAAEECSSQARIVVPLRGSSGDKKGKLTIKLRAETSPASGKTKGLKDTDKLKLTCSP